MVGSENVRHAGWFDRNDLYVNHLPAATPSSVVVDNMKQMQAIALPRCVDEGTSPLEVRRYALLSTAATEQERRSSMQPDQC
jgi:hypothetical protein